MKRTLLCLSAALLLGVRPLNAQPDVSASTPASNPRYTIEHLSDAATPLIEKRVGSSDYDATLRLLSRNIKGAVSYAVPGEVNRVMKAPMPEPDLALWGVVGYSDHNESGTMNAHRGFYSIDGSGNFTKLDSWEIGRAPGQPAAFTDDGRVVMLGTYQSYRLFSTSTWTETETLSTPGRNYNLYSCTWDPYTAGLLACTTNIDDNSSEFPYQLVYINITTMERTVLDNLAVPLYAIAVDNEGKIYALTQDFDLVTYGRDGTPTTVKTAIVPFTLDKAFGGSAMMWDQINNRLLVGIRGVTDEPMASANPFPGCLYWIDPATGDATMILQFTYNDEIKALAYPNGAYIQAAPTRVADLKTEFTAGSMKGNVSFTAPANAIDGTALSGDLTYYIYSDGNIISSATIAPGEAANLEVTAPDAGRHTIAVQLSNTAGRGPVAGNTLFIGNDVPNAPVNITASLSGSGVLEISWSKVTDAVNGGFINPDQITYQIIRYNLTDTEEEPVELGESSTNSFSISMEEPAELTDYQFGVTATFDGKTSPVGRSNVLKAGLLATPWSFDFSDEAETEATFSFLNYNGNNYGNWSWGYDGWGDNKNGHVYARRNYSESGDVDKWLVSPGLRFLKDKVYRFDVDLKNSGNNYQEQVEVLVGTDPENPETWTNYVIEPTDVTSNSWTTFTGYITVPADDKYYVALHFCTPSSRRTSSLYVDNMKIGDAVNASAPGSVSNLKVTPAALGYYFANVSFTTPTKNFMQTENLTSLTAVRILRNGELVKTIENPALGTELTFKDENLDPGAYTYSVVTVNADGEGPAMSADTYVGVKLPTSPQNVSFEENPAKLGEVTITWDAVNKAEDGSMIPPTFISYDVVELIGDKQILIATVTEPSYTYQAVEPGQLQQFKRYAVFAETESGVGRGLATATKPVGDPSKLPFAESYANAGVTTPIAINGAWGTVVDGDIVNGPVAVDGDNGYMVMIGTHIDETADYMIGKLDLTEAKSPYLSFWTYNIVPNSGDPDLNEFRIIVTADGEQTAVKSFAIAQECRHEGWNRILVDLRKFAGKTIELDFRAKVVNMAFVLLDDVRVFDAPDHDLVIKDLVTPDEVDANKPFNIRTIIENYGSKNENDYTINIYRDNEKVVTAPGKSVSPTQTVFIDLSDVMSTMLEGGRHTYRAEIVVDGDNNTADNVSVEMPVSLKLPKYPTVENLSGESKDGDIVLQWEKPTIVRNPEKVTESFEDFDANTQYFDEWSRIDSDGQPIYGFTDLDMPGLLKGAPQSWFVIDESMPEFDKIDSFGAYEGSKMLGQFLPEEAACDDWLISPALIGKAQEIDFYARAYFTTDVSEFEFGFATDEPSEYFGFSPYNFTTIARVAVRGNAWTHYTFEVPDGAKYFAVRANSVNGIMLLVDNFTYRPRANSDLKLRGYNVYHNGKLLNTSPIASVTFTDKAPEVGSHDYAVTAVFDKGESIPMLTTVGLSGLDAISVDGINVTVDGRNIIVTDADGRMVSVANAAGMMLYNATGAQRTIVPVSLPGVYVVAVGESVFKVVVR